MNIDRFTERTHVALGHEKAHQRDVESLHNWLEGTGCIAREERAYLEKRHELQCLTRTGDNAVFQLEAWIEDKIIRAWPVLQKRRSGKLSTDNKVHIFSGEGVRQAARALLLLLITLLLLVPVIVCNFVSSSSARITIVTVSTVTYLKILLVLTKSKTFELTLAGATYVISQAPHLCAY
ncbi:hypothetical protein PG993_000586 [Apiospora rasikravindrae]|uniref:DUF6594 domain-containing protein n=1 Tax=Apiospora rasikravindrae TaxID=990691 RepID=A0ABR1U909_9PEZI